MSIARFQRFVLVVFAVIASITYLVRLYHPSDLDDEAFEITSIHNDDEEETNIQFVPGVAKPMGETYTKTIVMARLKSDDISWVYDELSGFNTSIYTVDDANAELPVPQNKGREAMAYLTYIIDNYDNLPDTVLFFHPHRSTWHNNVLLDLDSAKTIQRLNPARVAREGYFNARCHLDPGCPNWLHVNRPKSEWDLVKKKEEPFLTSHVWHQLHPSDPIPSSLSQPCCAQFAVSGARIRARPLSHYHRYRDWLLNTTLDDDYSGRILEYNWQYIFTGQSEFCPSQHECYCDGYGICFGETTTEDTLQHWLDLLRQRELLDREIDRWKKEDRSSVDEEKIVAAERERAELVRVLDEMKLDAYRRGEDPRVRAKDVGRVWKLGDGF